MEFKTRSQFKLQHYPVHRVGEVDQEADHLVAKRRAIQPQAKPPRRVEGLEEAQRHGTSTRAPPRTLDRAMTLPDIPESQSPNQQFAELGTSSQVQRYQLKTNMAPRYK